MNCHESPMNNLQERAFWRPLAACEHISDDSLSRCRSLDGASLRFLTCAPHQFPRIQTRYCRPINVEQSMGWEMIETDAARAIFRVMPEIIVMIFVYIQVGRELWCDVTE